MSHRLFFYASLTLWLVMTGLLIEREVLPRIERGTAGASGYRLFLEGVTEPRVEEMEILVDGKKAGTTRTETIPLDDGTYRLITRLRFDPLKLASGVSGILGELIGTETRGLEGLEVTSEYDLWIGEDFRLRELHVEVKSPFMNLVQEGAADGEILHLRTEQDGVVREERLYASEHPLFGEDSSPMVMPKNLEVGDSWEFVRVNPLAPGGEKTIYEARVVSRESHFEWQGESREVFVVHVTDRDHTLELKSFVTPQGETLEQHLPSKIVLRLVKSRS